MDNVLCAFSLIIVKVEVKNHSPTTWRVKRGNLDLCHPQPHPRRCLKIDSAAIFRAMRQHHINPSGVPGNLRTRLLPHCNGSSVIAHTSSPFPDNMHPYESRSTVGALTALRELPGMTCEFS